MTTNQVSRHKVFISYYHEGDQEYKDRLVKALNSKAIDKSVIPGDVSRREPPSGRDTPQNPGRPHRRRHRDHRSDRPLHLAA